MERFILFPKNEFRCFNEGKKCFKKHQYQEALNLFEKAVKLKYLMKDCIKYLIDCHIELHHFEEVYKMIENEFVDKNVDEEYLLKKYLYTMFIEEQYIEVRELIKMYVYNQNVSKELRSYLDDLHMKVEEKLNDKNHKADFMMKYFLSDNFEDHIEIILNLDKLDVSKYKLEINNFLSNPKIDSFVKFNLLKHIMDNKLLKEINYINYYQEKFKISQDNFIDLLNDSRYLNPIEKVLKNVSKSCENEVINNIWLDFCIRHYPHLIDDLDLASSVLHVFLLKSLNKSFNIKDICQLYNVEFTRLFHYFDM